MTTETVSVLRETLEQLITPAKRAPWKTVGQANAIDEAEAALQQAAAPDLSERYREALVNIAGSKSLTATPTQFVRELQRMASDALAEFPKPQQSKVVCGECHLPPSETCDICGAKQPHHRRGRNEH